MTRIPYWLRDKILLDGHNPVIPVTAEQLSELSQLVVWDTIFAAAAKVQISSSSAADTAAGTGARTVEIIGCNDSFNIISEVLALNGQTQVESVLLYRRVFEVNVLTTGTGIINAGDIYVVKTGTGGTITAGVPGTLTSGCVKIPVGYAKSTSGVFVVPAGKQARLETAFIGAGTQGAVFQIVTRNLGVATDPLFPAFSQVVGINTGLKQDIRDQTEILPAGTQIELKALGLAASSNMWAKVAISIF